MYYCNFNNKNENIELDKNKFNNIKYNLFKSINTNLFYLVYELNLSNSDIIKLPHLDKFNNLKILNCKHNNLSKLPKLPKFLKTLNCSYNKLIKLPSLHNFINLENLICNNNKLITIPNLPYNLNKLLCHNNFIQKINIVIPYLKILDCHNNKLTYINIKFINSLFKFYCYDNDLNESIFNKYNKYFTILNYECSICYQYKHNYDFIILNNCKHKFCDKCINTWIYKYNNTTCPICRMDLTE